MNVFLHTPQVLLGITVSWLICYILTVSDVLPSDPNTYGHLARTDTKGDVIGQASWIMFPYPGRNPPLGLLENQNTNQWLSFPPRTKWKQSIEIEIVHPVYIERLSL